MAVHFYSSLKIKIPSKKNLRTWVEKIALSEKRQLKTLTYNFCSDEELFTMNKQFLNHTTYTDILTFDYSDEKILSGEVYISIDRVKENAEKFKISFADELIRVMAHGILHLCSYKDKTPIQQQQMLLAENRAIKLYNSVKG